MERILFHEEDGHAFLGVQVADHVEDLAHDDRRETERRFVEQQKLWPAHQRAGDGEHLLLAARQGAGPLLQTLLEAREDGADLLEVVVEVLHPRHGGAHLQVLVDCHPREDATALRRLRDAELGDVMRLHPRNVATPVEDRAFARPRAAEDRHHQRGFAGSVRADQRDDLALVHIHVHALEGLDLAVEGLHAPDLQHGLRAVGGGPRSWSHLGFDLVQFVLVGPRRDTPRSPSDRCGSPPACRRRSWCRSPARRCGRRSP